MNPSNQFFFSRAISAGARCPMLITLPSGRFPNAQLVAAIGVLHGMYTPMVVRESARKADLLGILEFETTNKPTYNAGSLVKMLQAIQLSFDLCRDIGDGVSPFFDTNNFYIFFLFSDPQRMSPLRVAEHIKQSFNGSSVKVSVTDEIEKIVREYPLMAAVTRAANMIEEHRVGSKFFFFIVLVRFKGATHLARIRWWWGAIRDAFHCGQRRDIGHGGC
jgi:leucyl aminopeptidase